MRSATPKLHPFIKVLVITFVTAIFALGQSPKYDLLLKGGHVIDPANQLDSVMDVAVSGKEIVAVAKDIPEGEARKVVILPKRRFNS